jgi:hypothetical protein
MRPSWLAAAVLTKGGVLPFLDDLEEGQGRHGIDHQGGTVF